jgi:hypothetical protein
MNSCLHLLRLVVLSCNLAVLSASGAAEGGEELAKVLNGDFEARAEAGDSSAWQLPANATIAEENGNRFLRLAQEKAGNAWISQKVKLAPESSKVRISGRVRLRNLQKGDASHETARLQYNFEDAKAERIGEWPIMPTLEADTDWKEVSVESEVPDGATGIALWPGFMESAGTLDLDDIRVTALDGGPYRGAWPPGGSSFFWDGKMPAIPEEAVQRTLVVDGSSPTANDANDGSPAKPFKTISAAMQLALQQKKEGIGVRVLVKPGLYRETVLNEPGFGNPNSDTAAPLVLEAEKKGTVIVSGADRWSRWKSTAKAGVFVHPWKFKWGVAKNPWGTVTAAVGEGGREQILTIEMGELARRAEAVFSSGKVLRQVLRVEDLKPGVFFVDEAKEQIFVQLSPGAKPQDLEISTRTRSSKRRAKRT